MHSCPAIDRRVSLLLRRDGTVQLGSHPESALVLTPPDGVTGTTAIAVLRLLDGKRSRPQIIWLATRLGFQAADMTALLAELDAAGLLTDRSATHPRVRSVRVHGRGPLSDAIRTGLAATGVRVTSSATTEIDIGRWQSELVLLADDQVADPGLVAALNVARIPHLQVRIRDGMGIVGPLVLPGVTSCLRCADFTRCAFDPEWPHLAAQLLGRVGHATPATVLATSALALAQVETLIAGGPVAPRSLGATIELDLSAGTMETRRWPRHRLCECRQLAPPPPVALPGSAAAAIDVADPADSPP